MGTGNRWGANNVKNQKNNIQLKVEGTRQEILDGKNGNLSNLQTQSGLGSH